MRSSIGLIVICAFSLAALSAQPDTAVVRKLSLDDTSTVGLKIESDAKEKIEGKASLKIATKGPASVCIGSVDKLDIDDAKLVYSAQVKSDLKGAAHLEMWVEVDGKWFFSKGLQSTIEGKAGWKGIKTPFFLQKNQKARKAMLNVVINGTGTLWVDSVLLTKEPRGGHQGQGVR